MQGKKCEWRCSVATASDAELTRIIKHQKKSAKSTIYRPKWEFEMKKLTKLLKKKIPQTIIPRDAWPTRGQSPSQWEGSGIGSWCITPCINHCMGCNKKTRFPALWVAMCEIKFQEIVTIDRGRVAVRLTLRKKIKTKHEINRIWEGLHLSFALSRPVFVTRDDGWVCSAYLSVNGSIGPVQGGFQ